MAAGFFNHLADSRRARAVSAGTHPADHVNPIVIDAMRETGIDLSANRPRLLTDDLARDAVLLVTMGCGEACPHLPGLAREDWALPDPAGRSIGEVRPIRDEIHRRVAALLRARGWAKA